jgi:cytosine/adenosine deaminase-related metal-dependent hydrolase
VDDPVHLVSALCDGRGDPAVGDPADLVLIRADSLTDALARRPRERIVLRGGRVLEERLR